MGNFKIIQTLLLFLFLSVCFSERGEAELSCGCPSFAPLVEHVLPAVVDISTRTLQENQASKVYDLQNLMGLPEFQNSPLRNLLRDWSPNHSSHPSSLGSGFIIDSKGYIVTNRHIVQDAEEVLISLSDGREMPAQIIARDSRTDLALLKVNSKDPLPFLKWGNSQKARVGDWILVVGSPFGFGRSVSAGIISARARDVSRSQSSLGEEGLMSGYVDDLLQTDAAINLGNSGGPMVNMQGEVIGVNVAIFSPSGGSVGVGFSVPSFVAERTIQQMITKGRVIYGWIGIRVQELRPDIAKALGYEREFSLGKRGAFVSFVTAGGPASKAGILPADIILSYDGIPITAYEKLPRLVGESDIGKKIKISLWRQGKELSLPVTIEEWQEREAEILSDVSKNRVRIPLSSTAPGVSYQSVLGLYLAPLTPAVKSYFSIPEEIKGVLVVGLEKYSESAGSELVSSPPLDLQVDDVIEEINQIKIKSFQDLESTIQSLLNSGKTTVLLKIWRQGLTYYVALNLREETHEGPSAY